MPKNSSEVVISKAISAVISAVRSVQPVPTYIDSKDRLYPKPLSKQKTQVKQTLILLIS